MPFLDPAKLLLTCLLSHRQCWVLTSVCFLPISQSQAISLQVFISYLQRFVLPPLGVRTVRWREDGSVGVTVSPADVLGPGASIDKASQHFVGRLSDGVHRAVGGTRVSLMLPRSPGGCPHSHSLPRS